MPNFNSIYLAVFLTVFVSLSKEADDNFYTAAVVEYNPRDGSSGAAVDRYISLIGQVQQQMDIIIFPESTLSGRTEVPDPISSIVPCDNAANYTEFFTKLSCGARNYSTYIVVNLVEQAVCTPESQAAAGDDRPCSSTGYNIYNTDVAFDRDGTVISRYRKFNLFGEYGKNTTLTPDISEFTTDFNVTFGMFTCFDLLFEVPSLALVRNGVRNIIFPTMWFSEMPFLTALQAQQMFAYTNDVNFLSAGANSPSAGSGGTGIWQGSKGPLVYDIIEEGATKVYITKVGKDPETVEDTNSIDIPYDYDENIDIEAKDMDTFKLKRDAIDVYTNIELNTTTGSVSEILCHENDDVSGVCCHFTINITTDLNKLTEATPDYYRYRLLAYTGVRSYDGVYNGGIEVCAVLACTNETMQSCGYRFSNYSTVAWPTTFESVEIRANFTDIHSKMQYPNSLLSSIRPIYPNSTSWTKVEYESEEIIERTYKLNKPQDRLITFAIWGRDFARDFDPNAVSEGNHAYVSFVLLLVTAFACNF